ncbi:MAG TPA: PKD domain-containing protein [Anaerolineae bacterium]|nr:PKD domain-containing protein [Anaerolineae bacterium]
MRRFALLPAAARALVRAGLLAGMLLMAAAPLLAQTMPGRVPQAAALSSTAGEEPSIVVTPGFLAETLCAGSSAWQALTICNQGGAELTWAIGEVGGPASDVPWLSEDPTGGALSQGACQEVTVTFDATGLFPGLHMAQLIVSSNDPDTPAVTVPAILWVPIPVHDADFSWQPPLPVAGEEVTFQAWAGGDEPVEFAWDLGDGSAAGGAEITHTYSAAGDYLVALTAANACGQTTVQQTVTVAPARIWLPMITR